MRNLRLKRFVKGFLCAAAVCCLLSGTGGLPVGAAQEYDGDFLKIIQQGQMPFYGIWCYASKDREDADYFGKTVAENGFPCTIVTSTDWSNLNRERWYVITVGKYKTEQAAYETLEVVQKVYPNAYVKYSGDYQGAGAGPEIPGTPSVPAVPSIPGGEYRSSAFYGIWCAASKAYDEAVSFAEDLKHLGWDGRVYLSTDWGNLNSEPWYVVSAGEYGTEADADRVLSSVQRFYGDAYVKYSGEYRGADLSHPEPAPEGDGGRYGGGSAPAYTPFYGIWCGASQDYADAQRFADEMIRLGFSGQIYNTADWENLNSVPWYVVTAGTYETESGAYAYLSAVQAVYPDAYVKYTGAHR